jgi:hypothetical protein
MAAAGDRPPQAEIETSAQTGGTMCFFFSRVSLVPA